MLLSTYGGESFYGLSAYNFLKGIPAEIVMHNFGSMDSVGIALYCSGSRRLSVPHARFMLHSGSVVFQQDEQLDAQEINERSKALQVDMTNIAGIIAENTGRAVDEVTQAMRQSTVLTPQ